MMESLCRYASPFSDPYMMYAISCPAHQEEEERERERERERKRDEIENVRRIKTFSVKNSFGVLILSLLIIS